MLAGMAVGCTCASLAMLVKAARNWWTWRVAVRSRLAEIRAGRP